MKSLVSFVSALALSTAFVLALEEAPATSATTTTTSESSPAGKGQRVGRKAMDPEKMLKRLDKDDNASVSLEEFKASPRGQKAPDRAEAMFKRRDLDKNGSLNLEELKTEPAKRGGKRKKNAQ
ncbi:MAG TPA: hypothetical protein VGO90_00435 [Chthoniobacteraceae bacterium]|jgi:Ca2+-binding EF-hand superfamily protein|nr:hypothetical protein [Chthoniobacteraceae bacterium]